MKRSAVRSVLAVLVAILLLCSMALAVGGGVAGAGAAAAGSITGQTAAEIIISRADHTKENMGLETWKHAPDGRILKSDVTVAKNYLPEKEIKRLERAVTGFFDYIEDLIERENTFTMEQFASSVDEFLHFRRYQILPDKGKVKKADAEKYAKGEYDIFNRTQPIESDFDREVKKLVKSQEEE